MALKRVLIDWDWGASGIWTVQEPDDRCAPREPGEWRAYVPPPDHDRHWAWRGLLSHDLIDALQAWNHHGAEVWGVHAHKHTDDERAEFWGSGRTLAAQVQEQLGSGYDVVYRIPERFSIGH
jgi:hypothetical protein